MGPFDPSTENWISYEERFRLYLTANEVTSDEKKQAIFLTTCGTSTYNLLRSLAAPKKPPELPFAELVKLAAGHYHPKPSLAIQRFKFFSALSPRWRICCRVPCRTQTPFGAL